MNKLYTNLVLAKLVLAVVLVFAPTVGFSQASEGALSGQIRQTENRAALKGVIVTVEQTGQAAVTDEQGRYSFRNLPAGEYVLRLSYVGYAPRTESVEVLPGEVSRFDFTLDADATAVDEIVVTGQRAAQASALNQQRAAFNVRNVVSADQAGRFPDFNAAESLRRVPGISVQREPDAGDGRYVSIRGLDSGLNNFQINGQNAAQQEPDSRRVPLDMMQTGALSSITVHKTLLPDHEADGIGGAVVLETATAFDFGEPIADLTISGFYHDLADEFSPMFQATGATRFGDGSFGILASVAGSKRETLGYIMFQDEDYVSFFEDDPTVAGVVPEEHYNSQFRNSRENISGNVAFNWAVSDATELVFKSSYSRLYDTEEVRALWFELGSTDYDDEGRLIDTEPGHAIVFGEYEETELTQQSYILDGVTQRGGFRFDYGVGFSTGLREEPNDFEVGFGRELESNLHDYDYSGRFPGLPLTENDRAAIGNIDGYVLRGNDIDVDDSKNTRRSLHLDVAYEPPPSWLRMIKAGLKFERSTHTLIEGDVMDLVGPLTLAEFGTGEMLSLSQAGAPYAPFPSVDFSRLADWRRYSQSLIDDNPAEYVNDYVESGAIPLDSDSFTSDEDIYAAYLMGTGVWDRWEVIGGFRLDHTRVSADIHEAFVPEDGPPEFNKLKVTSSYTNVLPRLQANFRWSDYVVLRGAVYSSIARPEPVFVAGATEIEIDGGEVDIFYGNPDLEPAYAWNYDLSLERYFGSIGLISVGVFYKDISRFIFSSATPEAEGDQERFANDPRLVGREIDDVVTYTNGKDAQIFGVELNLVHQFSELPGALGGLGVYANLTLLDSRADTGDGVEVDFFNAPETVYTAALTYQKYGIESTVAYSWVDEQVARFSSYMTPIVEDPYGSLDVQFRYSLNDWSNLFINAVDILNEGRDPILDQRYGRNSNYPENVTFTGRTVTMGIAMNF